ncbi:MAG: hypothetical protein ABUS54_09500 [Actinomycetota bacterium]
METHTKGVCVVDRKSMASFPNVLRAVPRSAEAGRALLLAFSDKRAANSNAAVDAAVVATFELATLHRNDLTSASSWTSGVLA